jgi:hypothetical protein
MVQTWLGPRRTEYVDPYTDLTYGASLFPSAISALMWVDTQSADPSCFDWDEEDARTVLAGCPAATAAILADELDGRATYLASAPQGSVVPLILARRLRPVCGLVDGVCVHKAGTAACLLLCWQYDYHWHEIGDDCGLERRRLTQYDSNGTLESVLKQGA